VPRVPLLKPLNSLYIGAAMSARGFNRDRGRNRGRNRGRDRGRDRGPNRDPGFNKLIQREYLKFKIPAPDATPEDLIPSADLEPAHTEAKDDPFVEIGVAVNNAKALLDVIPEKEFSHFMRALDLYHGLKSTVKQNYKMMIATNASLKMYEMLVQQGLLACSTGAMEKARVFGNAELPGAFLVAINHYVKTMCPETNMDWVASSYFPESAAESGDNTILGDHYNIYSQNRARWLMGPRPNAMPEDEPNVSGDVTDVNVVTALADAVHARFGTPPTGATLYTADAGIDISSDYSRQEELTSLLNYGQILNGVLALAPGGNFVTKQYTFVTVFSRSLIALLATLFDEMYVVKPITSRPVNSEIYLVGKGFRGIPPPLSEALLDRLEAYQKLPEGSTPCDWSPLLGPEVFAEADAALLVAAHQIHGHQQVTFLKEASDLYAKFKGRAHQLSRILSGTAREVQEKWLSNNPMRRIRDDQQLSSRSPPSS